VSFCSGSKPTQMYFRFVYQLCSSFPFLSCHSFSSRLFSFATQCRVQSQARPDTLPPQYFARILVDAWVCPPISSCPSAGCNRQLSLTIWLESCESAIGCTNLPMYSATRQAATTNCYSSHNKVYWKNKTNQIIATRSFQHLSISVPAVGTRFATDTRAKLSL
jgi:hypothetical protein